ncbi:MAG: crossover junction endodeoxyribonuclease RuvC [Gammaproteobacteria bacterium]
MRILGVDPGLANTGWGVIENNRLLSCGVIRTLPAEAHSRRIGQIWDGLQAAVEQWQPQTACVERIFASVNAKSTLALGEARGAALAALWHAGVSVVELSALQVKKSVTGAGRADKKAVAMMVRKLLSLPEEMKTPPPDACDALACALSLTTMMRLGAFDRMPPRRKSGRRGMRQMPKMAAAK